MRLFEGVGGKSVTVLFLHDLIAALPELVSAQSDMCGASPARWLGTQRQLPARRQYLHDAYSPYIDPQLRAGSTERGPCVMARPQGRTHAI